MAPPRKHLPPNGPEIIRQAASNGLGEEMLARSLGLSFRTWKRMKAENPEVRDLYEEAKALEEQELVGLIMQAARGTPAEYDEAGNQTRAERAPYIPAAFFLLKARHGYRELGPAEGATQAVAGVQIVMPAQMSMEQLHSMFPAATAASLPRP